MSRIYKFDGQKLHMICIYEAYVGNGLYIYIQPKTIRWREQRLQSQS